MATGGKLNVPPGPVWTDLLHAPKLSGDIPTATTPGLPVATDRGCSQFMVGVPSGAAFPAVFRVEGMHAPGEGLVLSPGMSERFWAADRNISIVRAQGLGGATDVVFGIVAVNTNVG